ncbi:MAG: AMP-binding protein [Pseudomonadota bacterium]
MKLSLDLNPAVPFLEITRKQPARPALVVDGETYSYADVAWMAGGIAGWLHQIPREAPLRVGILAGRSWEAYAGILAASWVGGTFVPLGLGLPATRVREIAKRAKLNAVVVDRNGLKRLTGDLGADFVPHLTSPGSRSSTVGSFRVTGRGELSAIDPPKPEEVFEDSLAYLIFTSGTTGEPRGVRVSRWNLAHVLSVCSAYFGFSPEDRISQTFENSYDASIFDLFMAWLSGASLHVVPERERLAPAHFIRSHELTVWNSVPAVVTFLRRMNLLKAGSFPSLKHSLFGGEPFPGSLAKAWRKAAPRSELYNMYGPTELTIHCSIERVGDPPNLTPGRGVLSIGKPIQGVAAGIVDESGRFRVAGENGELVFSGPVVTRGYLDDPDSTNRRYRTLVHPTLGSSLWFATGDLGHEDAQGFFHLTGRADFQVKVFGQRVELEEVEFHLREIDPTADVVCCTRTTEDGRAEAIVAFRSGGTVPTAALLDEMKKRVAGFMIPEEIIEIEAIPRTEHGKADRSTLAGILKDREWTR